MVYGRQPVLEALSTDAVVIEQVLVATSARGDHVDEIVERARDRGVEVRRVPAAKVTRLSGNGRQDQGVVADVVVPGIIALDAWLARYGPGDATVVLLDGVTTPANVGMIIRAVAGAGLEATVVPRLGAAPVGPLVLKASAGLALRATILRHETAAGAIDVLAAAGFVAVGLDARGSSIHDADLPGRCCLVVGNESGGLSPAVLERLALHVGIPLAPGVESLNVATAAAVAAFEIARRRGR